MDSTGSRIDEAGVALYGKLVADPAHVAGALTMMAHWDLHALARDLPRLRPPLTLVVGARDRAVRPAEVAGRIIELSARTGEGLNVWIDWLLHEERQIAPAQIHEEHHHV